LKERNIIIDSNNNLNSDTFRNTSHTRILKSVNERIKQFELFKPGRNSITTTMKKSINNMPVINTKLIDKYCETNKSIKILNLEKEFEALPKQIKTERPENKFNILINKDKIKDLLKSKKLKVPINLKQGKITMKNMLNKNEETNQEISNVNDYIMNYSSIKRFSSDKSNNRIKIKLDKNFEKNNETNINKENNYSQTIKIGEKKLMIKKTENDSYYPRDKEKNSSKIQDNIINEYKENVNNNISSSENNSIEENNDRNNKNDKNERKTTSERSRSKFSSEKSDSGSEIIKKIVSENESFEKMDPLDDIEYLKKIRQEKEKENLKRLEHLLSDDDDNDEETKKNEENKEKRKSIFINHRGSKFRSVNKFDFVY
jgi:hypothetical protein